MSLCKVKISVLALAIAASPLSLGSTGVASPVGALFDSSDRSWEQSVRALSPTEMSQTQGDGLPLWGLVLGAVAADVAAVTALFGYYYQAKAIEEENQKQNDKQDPNDKRVNNPNEGVIFQTGVKHVITTRTSNGPVTGSATCDTFCKQDRGY